MRSGWRMRCVRLLREGSQNVLLGILTILVEQEVHPDILESMVDFLSTSSSTAECDAPGVSTRTYYWGDLSEPPASWRSIRSKEEGRMISGGSFTSFPSLLRTEC